MDALCPRLPTFSKNAPKRLRCACCNLFEHCHGIQRPTESRGNFGRSGPSVSANYRSARPARARTEFIARLGVVVDEADESEHWLSMLKNAGMAAGRELDRLLQESGELRAIFGKCLGTARANRTR